MRVCIICGRKLPKSYRGDTQPNVVCRQAGWDCDEKRLDSIEKHRAAHNVDDRVYEQVTNPAVKLKHGFQLMGITEEE